jgi:hypothetical protein
MGMMIIMARGAQTILSATSCQCWPPYDDLECHTCGMLHRSSNVQAMVILNGSHLTQGSLVVELK